MYIFSECRTEHTGLYKPHTIYLDCMKTSISYLDKKNYVAMQLIAIATDKSGNEYEIYRKQSIYGSIGFLAFPKNPDNIPGLYPYL